MIYWYNGLHNLLMFTFFGLPFTYKPFIEKL